MKTDVCVIGAGPAGLTSAIFAAQAGVQVVVIEKNATAGQKLVLTGGGRCNITHAGTVDDFVRAYGKRGRFLRHCLHEFSPDATRDFFGRIRIATKVYEDGCVFPISESAGNVQYALLNQCKKLGVQFVFGGGVEGIKKHSTEFIISAGKEVLTAHKVIIATGGGG